MNPYTFVRRLPILLCLALFSFISMGTSCQNQTARAAIIESDQSSAVQNNFDALISSTDLINIGQSSLASATAANPPTASTLDGSHDGIAIDDDLSGDTYYNNNTQQTLTYNLNGATGYDITGVNFFNGWGSNPPFSHQIWDLQVTTTANPTFTTLWSVNYAGIGGVGPNSSLVSLTDSTGVIATGVTAVRFLVTGFNVSGFVNREIDVTGIASVPEPSAVAMLSVFGLVGSICHARRRRSR